MPGESGPRKVHLWMWLLVIASALVRIVGVTTESFWNDEAFSGYATQLSSFADLIKFASTDVHPPGHLVLGWLWGKVFGISDFSLRMTSVIAGIALVPVVYRLGKQLFDDKTGFVSALLAAFLFQAIYYSQEFRAYMPMALMSGLTVTLILDISPIKTVQGKREAWRYVALATCLVANSYLHYFGLLFSILSLAILAWRSRKTTASILNAAGVGVVLLGCYAPWVPTMLAATAKRAHPILPGIKETILFPNVFFGPGWMLDALAIGTILVGFAWAYGFKKTEKWGKAEKLLLAWMLVPLLLAVAISYAKVPVYTPRNLFLCMAPAALLLGRAIASLRPSMKSAVGSTLVFLLLHHGIQLGTKGHFLRPQKQEIRQAAQYIADHLKPDEKVVAINWDTINFSYYLTQFGRQSQLEKRASVFDETTSGEAFWLASAGIAPPGVDELKSKFEILDSATFNEASVFHLRRR